MYGIYVIVDLRNYFFLKESRVIWRPIWHTINLTSKTVLESAKCTEFLKKEILNYTGTYLIISWNPSTAYRLWFKD